MFYYYVYILQNKKNNNVLNCVPTFQKYKRYFNVSQNLALHPPSFNLENYQATLPYKYEYEYFLWGGVPAVIFKETSGVLTHWNNSKSFV